MPDIKTKSAQLTEQSAGVTREDNSASDLGTGGTLTLGLHHHPQQLADIKHHQGDHLMPQKIFGFLARIIAIRMTTILIRPLSFFVFSLCSWRAKWQRELDIIKYKNDR